MQDVVLRRRSWTRTVAPRGEAGRRSKLEAWTLRTVGCRRKALLSISAKPWRTLRQCDGCSPGRSWDSTVAAQSIGGLRTGGVSASGISWTSCGTETEISLRPRTAADLRRGAGSRPQGLELGLPPAGALERARVAHIQRPQADRGRQAICAASGVSNSAATSGRDQAPAQRGKRDGPGRAAPEGPRPPAPCSGPARRALLARARSAAYVIFHDTTRRARQPAAPGLTALEEDSGMGERKIDAMAGRCAIIRGEDEPLGAD